MKINTLKRLYILLLWLCPMVVATTSHAQVYSTTNYRTISNTSAGSSFTSTPFSTSRMNQSSSSYIRRTSSQSYQSYVGGRTMTSTTSSYQGRIRSVASSLGGGVLVDNVGYIPVTPKKLHNSLNTSTIGTTDIVDGTSEEDGDEIYDDDEDQTEQPPQFAPLSFGWDAILFMLLLACAYAIYIKVRSERREAID